MILTMVRHVLYTLNALTYSILQQLYKANAITLILQMGKQRYREIRSGQTELDPCSLAADLSFYVLWYTITPQSFLNDSNFKLEKQAGGEVKGSKFLSSFLSAPTTSHQVNLLPPTLKLQSLLTGELEEGHLLSPTSP